MSGISLDTVDYSFHSIQIKDAAGDALAINGDGSINAVVTATDLDIRDLTHVSDSVKIGDGTDFLAIDGSGNIGVTDAGGSLTVDAVDLDIRNLAFATDSVTAHQGGVWSVSTTPDAYDVFKVTQENVTSTAAQIASTSLSGRIHMVVQNLGSADIYIGETSGVSAGDGLKIPKGSSLDMGFGASATVYAITSTGTSDIRIAEFAV
jgi:hypothetical protein